VVTRGRIEIISIENKFSPIHVKPSDIERLPKVPLGTNTWLIVDFIQDANAKYRSINFQVDNRSQIEDFVKTLCFAWEQINCSALFPHPNLAFPSAPLHTPPPHVSIIVCCSFSSNPSTDLSSRRSTGCSGRSGRPPLSSEWNIRIGAICSQDR
ncbi:hypothetical protein PFISCL1PPCAC_28360, partial [Pristionchus fissidentatus]